MCEWNYGMPHTKQQIESFLAEFDVSPRHRWGQNFLIDLNLMRLLVDAAELKGNETILEVGGGTGSMTSLLAEKAGAVIAVDIDPILSQIACRELAGFKNISLVHADILLTKSVIQPDVLGAVQKAREHLGGPLLLIANLPYQIASPLMINLLMLDSPPQGMYITIQAEVAQRIVAPPGTGDYGLLSVLLQSMGEAKILRRIKPTAFWPMPNVHSAMVQWNLRSETAAMIRDRNLLRQVINLLLAHRRKTIRASLALHDRLTDFTPLLLSIGIDPGIRAETLSPETFVQLANRLAEGGRKNISSSEPVE